MASDIINSRADLFRALEDTQQTLQQRMQIFPNFGPYENIERQLQAMKGWTASDRTPSEDERESIDVGLVALRQFEPTETEAEQDFVTNLHELNYYFENLPTDPHTSA